MGSDLSFNNPSSFQKDEDQDLQSSFDNPFNNRDSIIDENYPFNNSEFRGFPFIQEKEEVEEEKNIKNIVGNVYKNDTGKNEETPNIIQKTTTDTSERLSKEKEKTETQIKAKIFKIEKIKVTLEEKIQNAFTKLNGSKMYRKDYYFKKFKTKFISWLKNKLNKIKKNCEFSPKLEDFKIPNSLTFTSNPKVTDNYKFLSLKIKELLIKGENINQKNLQFYNKELIKIIESGEVKCKNNEKYEELISFINMSLKDAYSEFYEDEEAYKNFCNDDIMLYYEYCFKLENKKKNDYSILKKYGFIEILEKCHK